MSVTVYSRTSRRRVLNDFHFSAMYWESMQDFCRYVAPDIRLPGKGRVRGKKTSRFLDREMTALLASRLRLAVALQLPDTWWRMHKFRQTVNRKDPALLQNEQATRYAMQGARSWEDVPFSRQVTDFAAFLECAQEVAVW